MKNIICKPIGIIHSPHKEPKGTPIQPTAANGISATIEIYKEYVQGLKDLDGFSYVYLLYYFHLSKKTNLLVKPFMDVTKHGVFSTRAPSRPNHIGLSIVKIDKIIDNIIYVKDVDILDGTPLIDIKPFVPNFDVREPEKIGWLEKNVEKLPESKDDGRFI